MSDSKKQVIVDYDLYHKEKEEGGLRTRSKSRVEHRNEIENDFQKALEVFEDKFMDTRSREAFFEGFSSKYDWLLKIKGIFCHFDYK